MSNKNAFTLAEVLITLGIIGVVAALTLPSLIQNYQKQVWVNQLKKSYSTISQGFYKIMSDNSVDYIFDADIFEPQRLVCLRELNSSECSPEITQNILKYFKIEKVDITNSTAYLNGRSKDNLNYCWIYADGSMLGIDEFTEDSSSLDETAMRIYIDVNGLKKPNTYGRDVFYFEIDGHGIVRPEKGTDCGEVNKPVNLETSDGYSCAARIVENGWRMDY